MVCPIDLEDNSEGAGLATNVFYGVEDDTFKLTSLVSLDGLYKTGGLVVMTDC